MQSVIHYTSLSGMVKAGESEFSLRPSQSEQGGIEDYVAITELP